MVQINKNLGNLNVGGLSKAKGAEVQEEKKENFTQVEPLKIYYRDKDGKTTLIHDDGTDDGRFMTISWNGRVHTNWEDD